MTTSGYIVVGILLVLTLIARVTNACGVNDEEVKGWCDAITFFLIVLMLVTL